MGSEKQRLKILNEIKAAFYKADEQKVSIDKNKLILQICLSYGLTKLTASKYIQLLLEDGFIVEDPTGLWLKKSLE